MLFWRGEELAAIVQDVKEQAYAALNAVCREGAEGMEQYAKRQAPWTDRTGNARRTLSGFVRMEGHVRYIGVSGNMPYSPYLEMLHGKRFAILYPTVQTQTGELLERLAHTVIAARIQRPAGKR